jgi:hypothetical protein
MPAGSLECLAPAQ